MTRYALWIMAETTGRRVTMADDVDALLRFAEAMPGGIAFRIVDHELPNNGTNVVTYFSTL